MFSATEPLAEYFPRKGDLMPGKNAPHVIYLDHNATTPIDPEVQARMRPYMDEAYGNPSSPYALGARAREAVEQARAEVAGLIGCQPQEVIFTSGGSESNNTVLKGSVDFKNPQKYHIITSAIEHPAILNPALFLMELGVRVTVVPVDGMGRVDPEEIRQAIRPETTLVSIMLANNETGTLQPIEEISRITRAHGVRLHTDAAQAVGKIEVDVNGLGVDFLTIAGHKLYAPKGVGALYVRDGTSFTPLMHGGGQEFGKRAGTENVMFTTGLGTACRVVEKRLDRDIKEMTALRERLKTYLFAHVDGLVLNGHSRYTLPNTLNVSVPHLKGGQILDGLPGLMASTGAACHDQSVTLSHVLSAMGVSPEIGMGALRFSVGRSNTMDQMDVAAKWITDQIKRMRHGNP